MSVTSIFSKCWLLAFSPFLTMFSKGFSPRIVKSQGRLVKGLTHYQTTNLRLFQTEFADDNFKFYENGSEVSKPVENIVGKGEIARYEQFLLFQQCFQKACFRGASKGVIVWEWVKVQSIVLPAFSPFPSMFSKELPPKYYLKLELSGKGIIELQS